MNKYTRKYINHYPTILIRIII